MTYWLDALGHLNAADVLDIALAALFLFILIDWLRHHVSMRGIAIFTLLVFIEILALRFDLFMTRIMAQLALVLLVIIWLVVFQSDIRRTVDRIAIWGATRRSMDTSLPFIDILVESAAEMAERRMGALICLRGEEPWNRHIGGGIALNGKISQPLLMSIFSTVTPGHDGAVLIEGDEITRFAAHLPISSNQHEIGSHGTRHAAALGLSEVSDTFVIVVSEEHGTISVAHRGHLEQLSPGQLKSRLERFIARHENHDTNRRVIWRNVWLKPAIPIAIVSILAAVLAHVSLVMSEPVYRAFTVPIELRRLPPNIQLINPPVEVKLILVGPENAFRLVNPSRLSVRLDLNDLDARGRDFKITTDAVTLPETLRLVQSDPPVLHIRAQEKVAPSR